MLIPAYAPFFVQVECPVRLDGTLCGIVETWARGAEWRETCETTSLDQGDICRLVRRSMEMLRQIPLLPGVPNTVKDRAREGVELMNRMPVSDDIGFLNTQDDNEHDGDAMLNQENDKGMMDEEEDSGLADDEDSELLNGDRKNE